MEELEIADEPLTLGGDEKFDSPQVCPYQCFYPVYDMKSKKIISFQLNFKKDIYVKGSAALGAKLMIQKLKGEGFRIAVFTTDRSCSIKKMLYVMNLLTHRATGVSE